MASSVKQDLFAMQHATSPTVVCKHVLNGTDVSYFAGDEDNFTAVCSKNCLQCSENITIRMSHLTERQQDLAGLLHIPDGSLAIRKAGIWKIYFQNSPVVPVDVVNGVFCISDVKSFMNSKEQYFYITAFGREIEEVLENGMRLFPIWREERKAKAYGGSSLLKRLVTRVKKASAAELVDLARADGHNYLCIQEQRALWSCVIVEKVIDFEKNTLLS